MAKQDLVVKLMLDSGAFGNDIREAERKAKNFSDNIKGAGKTAGEFGKEIGLATGALGKLGSAVVGAGGVVAAMGAFKSIMESTHGTAKQFHGTISGFEGVLKSFQKSIATFDFTNFINGIDDVFNRYKTAKEAMMDFGVELTGYNYTKSENLRKIKDKKVEYLNATSDSDRKKIKSEANDIIKKMQDNLKNLATSANNAFKTTLISEDAGKIKADVDIDQLKSWTMQAMETSPEDKKTEQEIYNRISDRIADLNNALDGAEMVDFMNNATQSSWLGQLLNNAVNGSTNYLRDANRIDEIRANPEKYKQELADQINRNQGIFVRNALYKLPQEELGVLLNVLSKINDETSAINEAFAEITGWSGGGGAAGGSGGGGVVERKAEPGSLQDILKKISGKEEDMKYLAVGSKNWEEAREKLLEYKQEYERLLELQESYNPKVEKTLDLNTRDGLISKISELEKLRNATNISTPDWYSLSSSLNEYRLQLEKLIETQEEFDNSFNDHSLEKWNKKMDNAQITISSVAGTISSLGNTFSTWEKRSMQVAADITDMFGNAAEGIMEFISIQQAAATAAGTAQAAKMPFPYNLAAIATVTSTILSVFDNIRTIAGRFAEGGIVGGNSYSGDKLFAMVNSGEMILNKRQQQNLGNMIGGGGQVEFHISGDALIGVLNNGRNKRHLIS